MNTGRQVIQTALMLSVVALSISGGVGYYFHVTSVDKAVNAAVAKGVKSAIDGTKAGHSKALEAEFNRGLHLGRQDARLGYIGVPRDVTQIATGEYKVLTYSRFEGKLYATLVPKGKGKTPILIGVADRDYTPQGMPPLGGILRAKRMKGPVLLTASQADSTRSAAASK